LKNSIHKQNFEVDFKLVELRDFIDRKKNSPVIATKQKLIQDELIFQSDGIQSPNFSALSTADLHLLFDLYDKHFFECACRRALIDGGFPFRLRLSSRMTSAGGKTTMVHPHGINSSRKKSFEIAVSSTLLFQSFNGSQQAVVVGVRCHNRLQALQRIFEHELVHLIEMLLWTHSSCAKARFRRIANSQFGHLESNHQLTTPREAASARFDIQPGDRVRFRFEGRDFRGFVNRITRRATVLVPSRKGELFNDGARYIKYYVPVEKLRKIAS
jgi:hypothetical protein